MRVLSFFIICREREKRTYKIKNKDTTFFIRAAPYYSQIKAAFLLIIIQELLIRKENFKVPIQYGAR